MINKIKAGIVAVGASVAVSMLPLVAGAQSAFGTSTTVATSNTFFSEISLIIGGVIVGILSLLAALTGLGWAVRKYRHCVAGRKF